MTNFIISDWSKLLFISVVQQFSEEFSVHSDDSNLPSKHDLVLSLAVGGRWVTTQYDLQVSYESLVFEIGL